MFTAVLSVLLAGAPMAAPKGSHTSYGIGASTSCGGWLEVRKGQDINELYALQQWVLGYVTATGRLDLEMTHTDAAGMWSFIDGYCAGHPLVTLENATIALSHEMGGP